MAKIIILLIVVLALLLAGCSQQTANDLGVCFEKCGGICSTLKKENYSLSGFNQIKLEKQTGNLTVSCSCPCDA